MREQSYKGMPCDVCGRGYVPDHSCEACPWCEVERLRVDARRYQWLKVAGPEACAMKLKRLFVRKTPAGRIVFTWLALYVSTWLKFLASLTAVMALNWCNPGWALRWLYWLDDRRRTG